MIRISQKDFDSLKGSTDYDGLHEYLTRISRNGKGDVVWSPSDGTIYIRTEAIGEAFRNLLVEWTKNANIEVVQVPTAPAAAPVLKEDGLARLQREQREAAAETAKLIEDTANKRAAWYISHEGMLDNDFNRDLFLGWFDRNKAAYTAANVDLAVAGLPELQFAVWAPRLQPVESVRTLENGEPELSLDCTESQMRKASKAQLQDLSKRRVEFTQSRSGWSGSTFIDPTF